MAESADARLFAVGCYTPPQGSGRGVETFWFDGTSLRTADVLDLESPSYLAWHPSGAVLYAVEETAPGLLSELRVAADGSMALAGQHPTNGTAPCHLALGPDARRLFVANYGDGSISAFEVAADGAIGTRTDTALTHGRGPVAGRQDGPHAHMVVPVGADRLSVVDLGCDLNRAYAVTDDGRLRPRGIYQLPPGFGPRQFTFFPGEEVPPPGGPARGITIGELANEIVVASAFRDCIEIQYRVPATIACRVSENLPAHMVFSGDSRSLYVSNRGADVISLFRLDPASGELTPTADFPCGGQWPRHMGLVDGRMFVANQNGGGVAVLIADAASGMLTGTGLRYDVPSPACVVPRPS